MAGAHVAGYRLLAVLLCCQWFTVYLSKGQSTESKVITVNKQPNDSIRLTRKTRELIHSNYRKGFVAAGIDSLASDSIKTTIYLYKGQKYRWGTIRFDTLLYLYPSLLRKLQTNYRGRVTPEDFEKGPEIVLNYLTGNGYPYAKVNIDEIEISSGYISGQFTIDRGNLVKFDTVITQGNLKIKPWFMPLYLGIRKNEPFDERLIESIPQKSARLPYLRTVSPYALEFYQNTADVYLFVDREKANRLNGLVGIGRNTESNKTELNGELELSLQNSMAAGEQIEIQWRKPGPASQKLNTGITYPFLLRSPVGIGIHFKLYQQDSSYLNLTLPMEARFMMPGGNYIGIHYQWDRSIVQKAEFINPANASDSSSLIDFSRNLAGASFFYSNLDRFINPTRGTKIYLNLSGGYRTILKNPEVEPLKYDSIPLKASTFLVSSEIIRFFPLLNHIILSAGASAGYIITTSVFSNEMYRIGGLYSLRGFDEDFYRVSGYGIVKTDLIYHIGGVSSLFVFYDHGILTSPGNKSNIIRPYGFGAGINLEVRSGIFSLIYGLGKRPGEPLALREARIHFGVTARF